MKNKLASRLPIQQMIASVIHSANEKVAEDQSARNQKVKELISYEKKEHGHIPTPSEEEAEKTKMASIQYDAIEKLASSVEFIASHLDAIEFPNKGILQKAAEMSGSPQGAGKGEGALEVSQAIGGTQNYNTGHAHNTEASSSKAKTPLSGAREADGKTQLDNNMHNAPGGGSVAPTARYPEKGPLVSGPSASGHQKNAFEEITHPSQANIGGVGYRFAKHIHDKNKEKKATSIQDVYQSAVPTKEKAASILRQAVLKKLAGEDVMKANIEAERSADPLAGKGQLESFDATQAAPHQAGDASGGGFGNQGRRLIASNQAAIDATKGDAKGPVKTQLSEVLDEPALTSSTDPVLENNLQNTGKAGVKIAAARASLEKVAQQGCTCKTIDEECTFCRLSTKVAAATQRKRGSTKTANAMMGYGGGGGMPSSSPTMSGGGGGMMSMADAGAGAEGCTCGGTGECRICKLKAALAAAKAQGGGGAMSGPMPNTPVGGDTPGAAPVGTY